MCAWPQTMTRTPQYRITRYKAFRMPRTKTRTIISPAKTRLFAKREQKAPQVSAEELKELGIDAGVFGALPADVQREQLNMLRADATPHPSVTRTHKIVSLSESPDWRPQSVMMTAHIAFPIKYSCNPHVHKVSVEHFQAVSAPPCLSSLLHIAWPRKVASSELSRLSRAGIPGPRSSLSACLHVSHSYHTIII